MKTMQLQKADDGFAILTLDAEGSMNVVNDAFLADMEAVTKQIAEDDSITGVILTSAKASFMAGADLKQLVNGFGTLTASQAYAFSKRATDMHRAIEQSGKPWVAAINGLALGGGFELTLACHRRILVDDAKVQVGLPEVNVGLLPGSGGTVRLGLIAGMKTALDLLLSIGAGTGLVFILRWYWWRVSAWSEISAMLAATVTSVWLQLGVVSWEAARIAHEAGLAVVMARCTAIEWRRLARDRPDVSR